jgi:hypothetical protein
MIFYVRRDAELRRRWREDFDTLAREFGLSAAEIEAVKTADVRGLNDMGVHQYYVSNCTVPPIPSSERATTWARRCARS